MQRYDSYKDSGVKWLGEIPSHWEVKRLRAAFIERKERYSSSESLMILSLIKDKGIIPYDEKGEVGNKSKDDHTQYKVARKGDLVINSMNVIIGSLGVTPYDGYISPAYYAFKPQKGINLAYYNFLLSLRKVQQSIRCFSKGIMEIRLKISANDFLSMPFPVPSSKEQEAIANYLNSATSKIDEAISQQQKMIDLLNERKQIIINNAVTKGLDPNVKMKPSGIDWIGDIPEHWVIVPMKYCMKIKNGMDYKHIEAESGIPVIGSGGQFAYASDFIYDGEVVFFGRKGTVDKPLYFKGKFWAVDTMFYAIPLNNITGRYLYYQGLIIPYKYYATSTALPSMTQTDLGNNPICLPSLGEQNAIVEYLDAEIGKIDEIRNAFVKQIALLQERKQIIINDVVTGKVKVI